MRFVILFLALIISVRAEFQPEAFLEALAMKETGMGWNGKPGPCGELSKWQIMPSVWVEEMGSEPFENARVGRLARACALRHVVRLCSYNAVLIPGKGVSIERLATCWHFGASHRNRSSVWGKEVENLYNTLAR